MLQSGPYGLYVARDASPLIRLLLAFGTFWDKERCQADVMVPTLLTNGDCFVFRIQFVSSLRVSRLSNLAVLEVLYVGTIFFDFGLPVHHNISSRRPCSLVCRAAIVRVHPAASPGLVCRFFRQG